METSNSRERFENKGLQLERCLGRARKTFQISGRAVKVWAKVPRPAGGFPQTPLTEEFETQEVREQLYICEVLHIGFAGASGRRDSAFAKGHLGSDTDEWRGLVG